MTTKAHLVAAGVSKAKSINRGVFPARVGQLCLWWDGALLAFGTFAVITRELIEGEVNSMDRGILLRVAKIRTPSLTSAAVDVTALGSSTLVVLLSAFTLLVLVVLRDRWGALQLLTAFAGAGILTLVTKNIIERVRPAEVGQRAAAVAKVVANLDKQGAMDYTVVVVVEDNNAPGLVYITPYAATSIAEYFMEKGRDVLIVYDDLTHHARAYRELSLLLRRPPGREAFPGDIFYIHSRMLRRSTHLSKERGGGSLTALPIIETEAQDISAYIPTNLISITDGQVYLSPTLFQLGILPAVDVGKSVSRVGGAAQRAAYRAVAGSLKLAYSQFEELEALAKFGTRLDDPTQKTIDHGQRIRACLKQSESHPVSMIEQIIVLLALTAGLFDPLPLDKVNDAERALQKATTDIPADVAERLTSSDQFSDDDRKKILEIAKRALASLQPVPAAKPATKPAP